MSKLEGKTIFVEEPTGCQEPGLFSDWKSLIDVVRNLKQFNGLT